MFDASQTLFYKASLFMRDVQDGHSRKLLDDVFRFVHAYITSLAPWQIDYDQFMIHGRYETTDQLVRVQIGSQTENPPVNIFSWAAKIRIKDPDNKRRIWVTHIGIQEYPIKNRIFIRYAEFYQDYIHLKLTPMAAPEKLTPSFVKDLVCNEAFPFEAGKYPLPYQPIELCPQFLNAFQDMLWDPERSIPILMITCPDLLSPVRIAAATLGNAAVFYTSNPTYVDILNSQLPPDTQIVFDTLQVFLPVKNDTVGHRTNTADIIQRYGEMSIIQSVRRAFCECMSGEERQQFITYDDIIQKRNFHKLRDFSEECNTLGEQNKELKQTVIDLRKNITSYREEINILKQQLKSDPFNEAKLYEAEWSKSLQSYALLSGQIERVAAALYTGEPLPFEEMPANASMGHLLESLRFRLNPLSEKKKAMNSKGSKKGKEGSRYP